MLTFPAMSTPETLSAVSQSTITAHLLQRGNRRLALSAKYEKEELLRPVSSLQGRQTLNALRTGVRGPTMDRRGYAGAALQSPHGSVRLVRSSASRPVSFPTSVGKRGWTHWPPR